MNGETLADLVGARLRELGLGVREAGRAGAPIVHAAEISHIRSGKRVDIGEAKIKGLAMVLKVPERRVRAAVEASRTAAPLELPGRFNLLNDDLRGALIAVGDYLLKVQHEVTIPEPESRTPGRAKVQARRRPRT